METTPVDLGFLETTEPWLLTNKFFRSKVGGKPAWLELHKLPKPDELLCEQCKEPLTFLCQETKAKVSEEENEKRQMEEFERLKNEGKAGALDDLPEGELDKYSGEQVEDKTFDRFKERIAHDPDQVLRYERRGNPLWLSPVLPKEIPNCAVCAGPRVFEFQIMPQLLNSLANDSLDWGTLVCYTCEGSCNIEGYVDEFIYRQDVLNLNTTKE
ncbi:AGAP005582-PA-like protein [Anopheles sinensis]|uniref:AGAP005582-PA-like protein n=1 Tax=Anopheles sinensis TaxID=74873 RepID=A0A084WKP2_ANOSI|nr:AGAP005582-PA-like protein [Anopheles sinensis]